MGAIKWCPQHGYPLPCDKCGLGEYERGKAEGIKEAIEWIKTNVPEGYDQRGDESPLYLLYIDKELWQQKCKEWGIESYRK